MMGSHTRSTWSLWRLIWLLNNFITPFLLNTMRRQTLVSSGAQIKWLHIFFMLKLSRQSVGADTPVLNSPVCTSGCGFTTWEM